MAEHRATVAMAEPAITTAELHHRLIRAGQIAPDAKTDGTDVWPPPEIVVTVGMNCDPTLLPAYRRRYFACRLESEENPVPALRDAPAFALPARLREAVKEDPAADCFLDGPFRWLLRRIGRLDALLLWPARPESGSGGAFARDGVLEDAPHLRERLSPGPPALEEVEAIVLDPTRESDWAALWEVALRVSRSFTDFFVSDPGCREVYRMHHHGKVESSVPDGALRRELLDDLVRWSGLIEDCSGYVSDWDDEGDDD